MIRSEVNCLVNVIAAKHPKPSAITMAVCFDHGMDSPRSFACCVRMVPVKS